MSETTSRRTFSGANALVLAGGLLLLAEGCAPAAEPARKPNILLIVADDLGYGHLGSYGQEIIETPNLDRLAVEGMRFTDFYAGAAVCAPARSSLMTGQHTGHTRVRGNASPLARSDENPQGRVPLLADDFTLAQMLQQAGYATAGIGKWGLGEPGSPGVPNKKGFDYWFGYLNQRHAHHHYPTYLWRNDERVLLKGNEDGGRERYSHDLFVEEALAFLERSGERPFFLYLAFTLPHTELLAPEEAMNRYRGRFQETPYVDGSGHYAAQPEPRAALAAMITYMDETIGLILERLRERGLEEDTLVFFTSDNGAQRGAGADADFFRGNGPLRGYKGQLYEGGIRVPMIARWPGKIPAGTVSNQAWAFWDLMPTLAEAVDVEVPAGIDGVSMLPALLGKPQQNPDYLYWETTASGFTQAVRMGRWKAIRVGLGSTIELYDLEADVGETQEMAPLHPEIVARAEELFRTARTESEFWPMPALEEIAE